MVEGGLLYNDIKDREVIDNILRVHFGQMMSDGIPLWWP
jgi:hypothetical protein